MTFEQVRWKRYNFSSSNFDMQLIRNMKIYPWNSRLLQRENENYSDTLTEALSISCAYE